MTHQLLYVIPSLITLRYPPLLVYPYWMRSAVLIVEAVQLPLFHDWQKKIKDENKNHINRLGRRFDLQNYCGHKGGRRFVFNLRYHLMSN